MKGSDDQFRAILEHAPVMIDAFGADGSVAIWNRECERRLGWTAAEIEALDDPLEVFYPDPEQRARVFAAIERADGKFREYEVRAKDGSIRLQRWADFALPDDSRISVGYDVTAQRRTEAELRQAQKIQALGTLSAGIAHDFNNLLTIISSSGAMALQDAPESAESVRTFLREILDAAARGADLIQQLMRFSRRGRIRRRPLVVDDELSRFAPTLRRILPESLELDVSLGAPDAMVLADPTAIEQIVVNLVTNARDASDGHGHIRITTHRDRDELVLRVGDDGEGMPDAVRERVFEPFFTTKDPGRGTGLGLPMVHGLVQQHMGALEIDSEPGQGTRITIRLPVEPRTPTEEVLEPSPRTGRGETILVVEDDRSVATAASRCLQRAGYVVLTALDGFEALATLAEHPGVDLVLSDAIMPRMGGIELRERIQAAHPSVPVALTSGYSPDLEDEERLLAKPWTPDQLARFVRQVLDAR